MNTATFEQEYIQREDSAEQYNGIGLPTVADVPIGGRFRIAPGDENYDPRERVWVKLEDNSSRLCALLGTRQSLYWDSEKADNGETPSLWNTVEGPETSEAIILG